MIIRSMIWLTIACTLLCTGCAATRPVHYYTIQPPSPSQSASQPAASAGLILLVGDIATPEALQDGRIRYRVGANETGAYEYHRWVERPGSMVRNSLIRVLRDSGKYRRVLEASSSATGDYLIRGKLNEFDEVDGASVQTRISLQVELIDKKTNLSVWDRLIEHEEPVASKTIADVVKSLDRNLQFVVSQTAAETEKFLATRR